jgi:hypothetical protein
MVLLHPSAQLDGEDLDTQSLRNDGRGNRVVEQLVAEIEKLSRERDCLRVALVDAGFSLRVDRIAQYSSDVSVRS